MRTLCVLSFLMLVFSCGADHSESRLKAGREARFLLQTPEKLSANFWKEIDSPDIGQNFLLQRRLAWSFWSEMLRLLPNSSSQPFMVWQSWYSREDLQRIFRHLYENLGVVGRRERRNFSATEIADALIWNDHTQFREPGWDRSRFEQWLAAYDSDEKHRAIPGMQKILFNQEVMNFLLQNYHSLEKCQKRKEQDTACDPLVWPEHAVFLKTSWRRSENGFLVETFATDAESLAKQWQKSQWSPDDSYEPQQQESYALRLPSGQKFHLTGLHASLRLHQQWFWTSLWLGREARQEWAVDQPGSFGSPWQNYRLCSVAGWHKPLQQQKIEDTWPEPLAKIARLLVAQSLWNWCSNPYLEPGPNNQKTNCTGCHQYAGLNWTQQEFRRRLNSDLSSLLVPAETQGPADFVWSLFAGPEPLVQPLMDDMEYFDVYDPYQ